MIPTEWLGHRRASDGELVGYLVPGPEETWIPVSVLGLPAGDPADLDDAERCLDERGLGELAEKWVLDLPERADPVAVQIVEVSPAAVTVAAVDVDAAVEYGTRFTLDVPVTAGLRRR